jgi:hypothetical protein
LQVVIRETVTIHRSRAEFLPVIATPRVLRAGAVGCTALEHRTRGGRLARGRAVGAGAGRASLEGDRYFHPVGAPAGKALTLIEDEVAADIGLEPGEARRQLTVRGVWLNNVVGKRFMVADVECYGAELCEPCLQLQLMTRPGLIAFFSDMSVFAHFGCHARSRAPST